MDVLERAAVATAAARRRVDGRGGVGGGARRWRRRRCHSVDVLATTARAERRRRGRAPTERRGRRRRRTGGGLRRDGGGGCGRDGGGRRRGRRAQLSPRPKPPAHAALPSEPSLHPFRQVVHWQLRDMGMLLGTNQHVFSTDEHKAMSLQLCDVSRPLHPLSILNFWLDNVMAAIPATAVCGHVNGVVKGYHILKTEELPHWPGANFDADAVLDNAHALLSFLRAHCTRPGGSYWVLKEADADLIRVFDLHAMFAALRAAGGEQTNPFAASVGTMAFRMAQRRSSDDSGSGAAAAAASRDEHERRRELLLQCISLLDADETPLLASLAHAQLAEVCAAAGADAPTATLLRAAAASNDGGGRRGRSSWRRARRQARCCRHRRADAAAAAAVAGASGTARCPRVWGRGGAPLPPARGAAARGGGGRRRRSSSPKTSRRCLRSTPHSTRTPRARVRARVPLRRRCRRAARQRRLQPTPRAARGDPPSSSAPPRLLAQLRGGGRCVEVSAAKVCAAAVATAAPPRSLP